jgi:hypothetical protein
MHRIIIKLPRRVDPEKFSRGGETGVKKLRTKGAFRLGIAGMTIALILAGVGGSTGFTSRSIQNVSLPTHCLLN